MIEMSENKQVWVLVCVLAIGTIILPPMVEEASGKTGDPVRYVVGFEPGIETELVQVVSSMKEIELISLDVNLGFGVIETWDMSSLEHPLSDHDWVRYIEKDGQSYALFTPNDPRYDSHQWGPQKIGAPEAWDLLRDAPNVVVAVVDTGVLHNHEDLQQNMWVGPGGIHGRDFVNDDDDPIDDMDHSWSSFQSTCVNSPVYHGTHVAGTIGARINNARGIAGMVNAPIMAVKVLDWCGRGYNSDIAQGIRYAVDHGADIISMSLGSPSASSAVRSAVEYAEQEGVILVAASGNDNQNGLIYPAGFDETIAVGASDSSDSRASFSNFGSGLDVLAPGDNIYSASANDGYRYLDGTSMATPHASGTLALMLGANPELDSSTARSILRTTAVDLGPLGWDDHHGYGRVDAYEAVKMAAGIPSITVNPASAILTEGHSLSFSAKALDAYGNDITVELTFVWSVSPTSCGSTTHTVGPTTMFSANSNAGNTECELVAGTTRDGFSVYGLASVSVEHAPLSKVDVVPKGVTVVEGDSESFSADAEDQYGHGVTSGLSLGWYVTPSNCGSMSPSTGPTTTFTASVDAGGQLCTVTAESQGVSGTASLTLIHDVAAIIVDPPSASLLEGSSMTFTATDNQDHFLQFAWSVNPSSCGFFSNPTRSSTSFTASIASGGETCVVVASYGSDSGSADISLQHALPITVLVSPKASSVTEGESETFTVIVTDLHTHDITSDSTISWSVTPSSCGSFSPIGGSTTAFTASDTGGGQKCTVTSIGSYESGQDSDVVNIEIAHATLDSIIVIPEVATIDEGDFQLFSARVTDIHGHDILNYSSVSWRVDPVSCGYFSPSTGPETTFISFANAGGQTCSINATVTYSSWSYNDIANIVIAHTGPIAVDVGSPGTSVTEGTTQTLTAVVTDLNGHDVTGLSTVSWSVDPVSCGSFSLVTGSPTTFTSSTDAGGQVCTVTTSATFESYQNNGNADIDVVHAALDSVAVSPGTATIDEGDSQFFSAVVTDLHGHNVTADSTIVWIVSPLTCGLFSPATGPSTTFISSTDAGGQVCTVSAESQGTSGTASVTVMAPLEITASADPNSGDPPLTVSFTGLATGGTAPYTFSWDFDDGSTSSDQNPSHTFTTAGTYTVTLTVTDDASESVLDTVTIYVGVFEPTIKILEPVDNTQHSSTLIMRGTSTNATEVLVRIDGGDWCPASGVSKWSFTVKMSDGDHTIEAKACNAAGVCVKRPSIVLSVLAPELEVPSALDATLLAGSDPLIPTISVTFSQPMRRGSVEESTSLTPTVELDFIWNGNTLSISPLGRLLESTSYELQIQDEARAQNGLELAQELLFQFAIPNLTPQKIQGLTAEISESGQGTTISWTPVWCPDLWGYEVEITPLGWVGKASVITVDNPNASSTVLTELKPDRSYRISVTARDISGLLGAPATLVITVPSEMETPFDPVLGLGPAWILVALVVGLLLTFHQKRRPTETPPEVPPPSVIESKDQTDVGETTRSVVLPSLALLGRKILSSERSIDEDSLALKKAQTDSNGFRLTYEDRTNGTLLSVVIRVDVQEQQV